MDNLKALKKTVFFISFPLSFIGFLFPIYAYSKGISVMEVGLLYSVFTLFTIIMRPIVGTFIDKKGRKLGLILGIAFYSFVNLLLMLGEDIKYLMAARIFQGIASTFLWISVDTMISDLSHGKNRSEIFGTIDQSINKGDLLGVILGFIVVGYFWQESFKAAFSLYLVTSLISLYFAITKVEETEALKTCYEEEKKHANRNFNTFLILMGLLAFVSSLTGNVYLIYMRDNITKELYLMAYLFLPGAILSLFLPKRFGKVSDKHSREKMFIISILFTGILYILLPVVKSYVYFLIVHTLISIFLMVEGPVESALVIDVVGENQRGKSYGKYKFAIGMGNMLGPIAGSYIYENIGSKIVFYAKGMLIIILCIFSVVYFNRIRHKEIHRGKLINN